MSKRPLSSYSYTESSKKRFKPVVKATFPTYVRPMSVPRMLPMSAQTKFNDCTFQVTPAVAGSIPTLTCVSPTAAAPINPNGQSLCLITQGTGENQRIANKMDLYQIRINGIVALPSASQGDVVRMMLVRDKQCNGAIPAVTDVLQQAGATIAAGLALHSYRNMDNLDRFDILKDKEYFVNAGIGTSSSTSTPFYIPFKLNHKVKSNFEINYSGITGVIGEVKSTNYFLIVCSGAGVCSVAGTVRVYWKDR